MRRWLRRLGMTAAAVMLVLVALAVMTDRSADPSLYPPSAGSARVTVAVVSHGYHAGIVVPYATLAEASERLNLPALREVGQRFGGYGALEFGFGDEGFYRRAPTIAAVEVADAVRALLGWNNPTVVHVVGLAMTPRSAFPVSDIVEVELSARGFDRLAAEIDRSFLADERGRYRDLGQGLYGPSLFYRGVGRFHIFNVCNHWLARLLSAAGLATNPVVATWPAGLLADLVNRSGARRLALPPPAS